jgi:uncharacterized SAM-binding protein YcdF (DUF218 family)
VIRGFLLLRHLQGALRMILMAAGALLLGVMATPLVSWWAGALSAPWGNETGGKILIVLGGDLSTPQTLGSGSYWRCVYAALYWKAGHYDQIVLSGRGVAGPMRDFVAAYGVPRQAIVLEDRSTTTRENALEVASMLRNDPRKKVLLTSDYHSLRSERAFRKAGLDVTTIPAPDARKRANSVIERWTVFCQLVNETSKFVGYALRGWI